MELLREYQNGKQLEVWDQLKRSGDAVSREPLWTPAYQVAIETMKRARENVELLIVRLDHMGYRFFAPREAGVPWRGPMGMETSTGDYLVHRPPQTGDSEALESLEAEYGKLPLAIRAWYEVVGSVSFLGDHPLLNTWSEGLRPLYGDPLEVAPLSAAEPQEDENGVLAIPIAPDARHKANVSGGHEYMVALQPWTADPPVLYEPHNLSFVNYLRLVSRWGGFPGWDRMPDPPEKELAHLAAGLLPI